MDTNDFIAIIIYIDPLDSSEEAMVQCGGWIYSSSMRIFAKFKKDNLQAEIEVGTARSHQVGFNLTEQIVMVTTMCVRQMEESHWIFLTR